MIREIKGLDSILVDYYCDMSKFELSTIFYTVRSSAADDMNAFIIATFAYLSVAYSKAKYFSGIEIFAISGLYALFVGMVIDGVYAQSDQAEVILYVMFQQQPNSWGDFLALSLVLTAALSIAFMVFEARKKRISS